MVGANAGPGTARSAKSVAAAASRRPKVPVGFTLWGVPSVTIAPIRCAAPSRRPPNGSGDVSRRAVRPACRVADDEEWRSPAPAPTPPETRSRASSALPGAGEDRAHARAAATMSQSGSQTGATTTLGRAALEQAPPHRDVQRRRGQEAAEDQHGRLDLVGRVAPPRPSMRLPGLAAAPGARRPSHPFDRRLRDDPREVAGGFRCPAAGVPSAIPGGRFGGPDRLAAHEQSQREEHEGHGREQVERIARSRSSPGPR